LDDDQSDIPDIDDGGIDILAEVELRRLAATPSSIVPFQASLIAWDVRGPQGFSLRLNAAAVARIGRQLVTPVEHHTYSLRAYAGGYNRLLGSVTVEVDDSACQVLELSNLNIRPSVQTEIDNAVNSMEGVFRRKPDEVSVDRDGIRVKLAFGKRIDYFPDPSLSVDAQWTFRASDGTAVESFRKLDVSASVPWYAWSYPGAVPALAIALGMAKDSARDAIRQGAGRGAARIQGLVPEDQRLHSLRFTDVSLQIEWCPDEALWGLLPEEVREIRDQPVRAQSGDE
jgi:hypothetical protein